MTRTPPTTPRGSAEEPGQRCDLLELLSKLRNSDRLRPGNSFNVVPGPDRYPTSRRLDTPAVSPRQGVHVNGNGPAHAPEQSLDHLHETAAVRLAERGL